jgi:hypothetical protein
MLASIGESPIVMASPIVGAASIGSGGGCGRIAPSVPRSTTMDDDASQAFCYLTTTGRVSGRPHTIEIWFARRGALSS